MTAASLFAPPEPPPSPYGLDAPTGCGAYRALVQVALCRWAHKQVYERLMAGTVAGLGGEWPVGETPGRYLRFIREKLAGTGWTVLNERGDVCLCRECDEQAMRERLEKREDE